MRGESLGNFLIFKGFSPYGLSVSRKKLNRKKNPCFPSTTYFYYKNVSKNGTFTIKKIAKFSLEVIKLAHLLYKRRTFISNRAVQKLAQNQNFSLFRARFWPPRLLIKVRLLYNRCANFMSPSENLSIFFIVNVPFLETFL